MIHHRVAVWDDAYANGPNIPKSEQWPDAWVGPAKAFRDRLSADGRARLLAEYFASIVVDATTGRIIVGPEIHARGFAEDDAVFDEVKPKISAALLEAAKNGVRDQHGLQQIVRRTVGTWVNRRLRRRPMLVPLVIEA